MGDLLWYLKFPDAWSWLLQAFHYFPGAPVFFSVFVCSCVRYFHSLLVFPMFELSMFDVFIACCSVPFSSFPFFNLALFLNVSCLFL